MQPKRLALILMAHCLVALSIEACSSDESALFPGSGGAPWGGAAGQGGADASQETGGLAGQGGTGAQAGAAGEAGATSGGAAGEAGAISGGAAGEAGATTGGAAGWLYDGGAGEAGASGIGGAAGDAGGGSQGGSAGASGSGGAAGASGSSDGGAGTDAGATLSRFDTAADLLYDNGWSSGTNGGTGFGPWLLNVAIQDPNRNGFFLGSSSSNGSGSSPTNIDTAGRAFGLYANGNDGVSDALASAWRPFGSSPLAVGETVIVWLDNGYVEPPDGIVGMSFPGEVPDYGHMYAALPGSTTRFVLAFRGGNMNYELNTGGAWLDTGVPLEYGGWKVSFQLTGPDSYQVRLNDGSPINGALGGVAGTPLTGIAFFNRVAGPDGSHDFFCNSLEVWSP